MTTQYGQDYSQFHNRPNVGISACLMGDPVRFNGGHCHSKFCTQTLSNYIDFTPFCPEVAAGFGTPRPTMRLVGNPDKPTLTFSDDSTQDLTGRLINSAEPFLSRMDRIDGYILMKNSPSCGLERIKVYQPSGHPHQARSQGVFTAELKKRHPYLPLEEEGRLNDPRLRENFLMRVYALNEFKTEVLSDPKISSLIVFHSRYKYLIMAHDNRLLTKLGRLLANQKNYELDELISLYINHFMVGMSKPATTKKHSNVLQHIIGYLKAFTSSQSRKKIIEVIDAYRIEKIPLIVPVTLIKHYVDSYQVEHINLQRYLSPYPEHLGLRNSV